MKTTKKLIHVLLAVLVIGLGACKKEQDVMLPQMGKASTATPVINVPQGAGNYEEVSNLEFTENGKEFKNLEAITQLEDRFMIVSDPSALPEGLKAGDVIGGLISENTPEGFLRKVVSIENYGGGVKIVTTDAQLTEYIKSGRFVMKKKITHEDILKVPEAKEYLLRTEPELFEQIPADEESTRARFALPEIPIDWTITTGVSVNPVAGTGTVKWKGKINLEADLVIAFDVYQYQVTYFKYQVDWTNRNTFDAELNMSANLRHSIELFEGALGAIPVGPIVIIPTVGVDFGVQGIVNAEMNINDIVNENNLKMGMIYENGASETGIIGSNDPTSNNNYGTPSAPAGSKVYGTAPNGGGKFTPIWDFSAKADFKMDIEILNELKVRPYVKPKLKFTVFGIAYAELNFNIGAEFSDSEETCPELHIVKSANIGLAIGIEPFTFGIYHPIAENKSFYGAWPCIEIKEVTGITDGHGVVDGRFKPLGGMCAPTGTVGNLVVYTHPTVENEDYTWTIKGIDFGDEQGEGYVTIHTFGLWQELKVLEWSDTEIKVMATRPGYPSFHLDDDAKLRVRNHHGYGHKITIPMMGMLGPKAVYGQSSWHAMKNSYFHRTVIPTEGFQYTGDMTSYVEPKYNDILYFNLSGGRKHALRINDIDIITTPTPGGPTHIIRTEEMHCNGSTLNQRIEWKLGDPIPSASLGTGSAASHYWRGIF